MVDPHPAVARRDPRPRLPGAGQEGRDQARRAEDGRPGGRVDDRRLPPRAVPDDYQEQMHELIQAKTRRRRGVHDRGAARREPRRDRRRVGPAGQARGQRQGAPGRSKASDDGRQAGQESCRQEGSGEEGRGQEDTRQEGRGEEVAVRPQGVGGCCVDVPARCGTPCLGRGNVCGEHHRPALVAEHRAGGWQGNFLRCRWPTQAHKLVTTTNAPGRRQVHVLRCRPPTVEKARHAPNKITNHHFTLGGWRRVCAIHNDRRTHRHRPGMRARSSSNRGFLQRQCEQPPCASR